MVITNNLTDKIDQYLKDRLSEKRYRHSVSTARTASALCEKFNMDKEKGFIAGLVHDIAREIDNSKLIELSLKDGKGILSDAEINSPVLLHGRVGSQMIKDLFNIQDPEIIEAVKVHTTGLPGMGHLARIVFIADYIEPERKHMIKGYLSNLQDESLDNMLKIVLISLIEYLKNKSGYISEKTLKLLEELENERKK